MLQLRPWKIILVVVAALFGLVFAAPNVIPASATAGWPGLFTQRLNLGLDLQGGSYLLLEVDTDQLKKDRVNNAVEDARRELANKKIDFTGLGPGPDGALHVRITDPAKLGDAQTVLNALSQSQPIAQGGPRGLNISRGPDQTLIAAPNPDAAGPEATRAVAQTIEVVRRRVDALGTREPSIVPQGTNRIVVEAPGESDPEKLKSVIGKTAKLSFQMVDDSVTAAEAAASRAPPGSEFLPSEDRYDAQGVVVRKRVVVAGEDLITASQGFHPQTGQPIVNFGFNGRGAKSFADATAQNLGKRFAIILDGKVISAPRINGVIPGGSGFIEGNFTQESAGELSLLLRSGALPAKITVQEQRTVSAELGADAVKTGAVALGIGAIAIIVFIVLAYGLFGVFAAVALIVNMLMLIGFLSITQGTLTLPGVAGLILTLAVAVDANVLIYERMRDEERAGRTPLLAADHGFRRALISIFDANMTTVISALIMFQFGTGPVKGFALTLMIGVFTSFFTAVLITQVLIGWWFRAAKPRQLPI